MILESPEGTRSNVSKKEFPKIPTTVKIGFLKEMLVNNDNRIAPQKNLKK